MKKKRLNWGYLKFLKPKKFLKYSTVVSAKMCTDRSYHLVKMRSCIEDTFSINKINQNFPKFTYFVGYYLKS